MFMNTPKGKRWPHTFDGHGFTVVGGGATRLMTAFLDKSKAFVMVYADNLYWRVAVDGIGVCWVSLDGEKMEGSITTDFIREVIEYGLRHIDVKNQALDGFWHAICPEIFGKAIALLGASQIPLDHMASGNPLTHVCNRMQSMSWLGEWVHSRGLDPLSSNSYMDQTIKTHSYLGGKIRDWKENFLADDSSRYASSQTGAIFKLENAISYHDIIDVTRDTTFKVVDIDFLGHSVVNLCCFGMPHAWVAVMSEKTLRKALLSLKIHPVVTKHLPPLRS